MDIPEQTGMNVRRHALDPKLSLNGIDTSFLYSTDRKLIKSQSADA
jgi:hypothetical protein